MPVAKYIQDTIASGKIGKVHRVFADLSNYVPPDTATDDHRLLSIDLAGGVLLDIGVYALTWVFIALYQSAAQTGGAKEPVIASSAVDKYRTGVDAQTSFIVRFPQDSDDLGAHAIITTSVLVSTEPRGTVEGSTPAVRIQGSQGEAQVLHPIFRPERTRVYSASSKMEDQDWSQPGPGPGSGWWNGFRNEFGGGFHAEGEGHGMFWEADECARALRDGRTESSIHPFDETIALLQVVDQVRSEHDIRFPEAVETTTYPFKQW